MEGGLQIYPNPTYGELRISNSGFKIQNVDIFNITGSSVGVHHCGSSENGEVVINISHLPSGMYFIKIDTKQGKITKKIVKQ